MAGGVPALGASAIGTQVARARVHADSGRAGQWRARHAAQ
jgi:hypothetical protein